MAARSRSRLVRSFGKGVRLVGLVILVIVANFMAPATDETRVQAGVLSDCDDLLAYVADVTFPDNSVVTAGQLLQKTWRVRNTGTCKWQTGYKLTFVAGERMGALAGVPIPTTEPGDTADLTVEMYGPSQPGSHVGVWQVVNAQGQRFGDRVTIVVSVGGPAPPVPTATSAPTAAPVRQFSGSVRKWYSNCGISYVKGTIVDLDGNPVNGLRVHVWADGWDGAYSLVSGVGLTYGPGEWDVVLRAGQSGKFYVTVWDWQTGANSYERVDSDVIELQFDYTNDNCKPDGGGHQVADVRFTRNY